MDHIIKRNSYTTPNNSHWHRIWSLLARCIIVCAILGIIVMTLFAASDPNTASTATHTQKQASYDTEPSYEYQYMVLIDAGSSGTRVFVYRWNCEGTLETAPNGVLKLEPGLSSFAGDPTGAVNSLRPLIVHAEGVVPSHLHSKTQVLVLATAGLRLLPDTQSTDILNAIKEELPMHMTFSMHSDDVRILSGAEEGVYGWLAVNYLERRLEHTADGTIAVMDMGGGSAQIAFAIPNHVADDTNKDIFPLHVPTHSGATSLHNIYVVTRLGFGSNMARKRYVEMLRAKRLKSRIGVIKDPCMYPGSVDTWNNQRSKMFDKPINFTGTGDYDECLRAMLPLLTQRDQDCTDNPCTMEGILDIPTNMQVLGFSEFWYSLYDVYNISGNYNYESYRQTSKAFCARKWDDILQEYKAGLYPHASWSRFTHQCFKAAWMTTMLHHAYRIDKTRRFKSVSELKGSKVQWTLGLALERMKIDSPCFADKQYVGISEMYLDGDATVTLVIGGFLVLLVMAILVSLFHRSSTPTRRTVSLQGVKILQDHV
eukprot:m.28832 g.28832  ORF g.28832 m.28832 type:complete len:540 (-) comp8039_c0_seq1:239-1858(-)